MRAVILLGVVACGRVEFDPVLDTRDAVSVSFGENPDDTFQAVSRDVGLRQTAPTVNHGGCDNVDVDEDLDSADRGLFSFDVSALPAGATIITAELALTISTRMNSQMSSGQLLARVLVEAWEEGTECQAVAAANWLERMPGIAWTATASAPPTTADVVIGSVDAPLRVDQLFTIPVEVATIRGWLDDPGANFGLAIVATTADSAIVVSREGVTGKRPRLRVRYVP